MSTHIAFGMPAICPKFQNLSEAFLPHPAQGSVGPQRLLILPKGAYIRQIMPPIIMPAAWRQLHTRQIRSGLQHILREAICTFNSVAIRLYRFFQAVRDWPAGVSIVKDDIMIGIWLRNGLAVVDVLQKLIHL